MKLNQKEVFKELVLGNTVVLMTSDHKEDCRYKFIDEVLYKSNSSHSEYHLAYEVPEEGEYKVIIH
jgi:hypothetical protein